MKCTSSYDYIELIVIVTIATAQKEEENFKHLKFWPNEVWKLFILSHTFQLHPTAQLIDKNFSFFNYKKTLSILKL